MLSSSCKLGCTTSSYGLLNAVAGSLCLVPTHGSYFLRDYPARRYMRILKADALESSAALTTPTWQVRAAGCSCTY